MSLVYYCYHKHKMESISQEMCQEICDQELPCGHKCTYVCHPTDPLHKAHPCRQICETHCANGIHPCSGDCSTCFQGKLHQRCDRPCSQKYLYCSHRCLSNCNEDCPPCTQRCMAFCDHGRCEKVCYIPCEPCKEPCTAKCEHSACTKLCSEPCDRDPCFLPCSKKLQCGHMCIGYCGEICPPLCRFCNRMEIRRNLVLTDDARYIYLEGCHHTVDNEILTSRMKCLNTGGGLEIASCPACREPIYNLKRFSHIVTQNLREIAAYKSRQIGDTKENTLKAAELLMKLTSIGQREPLFESIRVLLVNTLGGSSDLFFKDKLTCVESMVGILETAERAGKYFGEKLNSVMFAHFINLHYSFFDMIKSRSMPFEKFEFRSLNREIIRLNLAIRLLDRVTTSKNVQLLLYTDGTVEVREAFRSAYTLVVNKRYFGQDEERKVLRLLEDIDKMVHEIKEREERRMTSVFGYYINTNRCPDGHILPSTVRRCDMVAGPCDDCREQSEQGSTRCLDVTKLAPEIRVLLFPMLN